MASRKKRGALINMDPSTEDPTYRYKMERVMIRSEGKNTGKVTVITNIESIADSIIGTLIRSDDNLREYPPRKQILRKTVEDVVKFLRRKIGGKVQFKKKRKVAIISGQHDVECIQSLIFEYIQRFTICPQCDIPELIPAVLPPVICRSCGHSVGNKSGNKHRKRSKKRSSHKSAVWNPEKEDVIDPVEEEKERILRRQEKKKEDLRRRLSEDPIFALNHFVDDLDSKEEEDVSCDGIMEKIKVLSLAHSLDRQQQIKLVVHCLMRYGDDDHGHKVLLESIRKYRSILVRYSLVDGDSDILMGYFEELVMIRSDGDHLLNRFHAILECLYQHDVVDEEEILKWYESVDHGFQIVTDNDGVVIRKKAEPFIKWLKEAEEEDDDGEGDGDQNENDND